MIDINKLKQALNNTETITQYQGAYVFNGNLVDYVGYEEETFPVSIKKDGDKIVIGDIGRTFNNLEEKDISLEDNEVRLYVENVLSTLQVGIDNNKQLFVWATNEQDCVYAMGRLYQAIILINYIELQYQEE